MEVTVVETDIFLLLKGFSKLIPIHVDKWREILDPLLKKVKGIANMSEQLRAVVETNLEYMPNFKEVQETLHYTILSCIEEDLHYIQGSIDKINRINVQFRDKLFKLETASLQLNWEDGNSPLLQGSPLIPPLGQLLQCSLEFYMFFEKAYKQMKSCMKNMAWYDSNKMYTWENAFNVDLVNTSCVNKLIAITQYIDNEDSLS